MSFVNDMSGKSGISVFLWFGVLINLQQYHNSIPTQPQM